MSNIYKLFSVLALALISALFASAQPSAAEPPAETRLRELIKVINSGDREQARAYIAANFNDEMRNRPIERYLGFFSALYDNTRGLEIIAVQETKPTNVTMLLKDKLTGSYQAMIVAIEDKAPYRVAAIGLRRPKVPKTEVKSMTTQEIARSMDAFMKKLAGADVFSGTVLLAKDGVPVFEGAYGTANKDFGAPNKIDTKFNLGSMNKMFTATAIAQLVEKGKLSFDDPLSKFIPDFPNAEAAQKIKIKHLLSHTAGLGGYFSKRYQDSSRANLRNLDDMMNLVRQDEKEIQFEPGTKWQYSNTGMLVLGKVIEIVTGQTYYDYVRENIYKPAGMTNTDCYELDKVNTNLAIGYDKQFTDKGITWKNNVFEHVMRGGPHGGGFSTVEDLLKFDRAFRSGKLVGLEYVKILTTAKPELNSPNYGYGFQVDADANAVGHSGGFIGINSNLDMFLGSGWTAVVMSNYSQGAQTVSQEMQRLVAAGGTGK
jgi:CubicO group peptidase (beta-lactamase class C family)